MKNSHAIKFGVFAGLGTLMFLFLFYWIEKQLMLSPGVIWSTMFLYILGMYMAGVESRKENGGFIDFKTALKAAFLVYVIANGIYHLYNYVLYNFLDPDMLNVQKAFLENNMEQIEGMMGEDWAKQFREGIDKLNYNMADVISAYISSLIGGFLLAAIIARIVRKNPESQDLEEI
jgi:hypothetical protein